MNWISKGFVPVKIGFILLLAISLIGCPQERLKDGLSVSLEQDGVYFFFDRYDILDIVIDTKINGNTRMIYLGDFDRNSFNETNNRVKIYNQGRGYPGLNFLFGQKYTYVIDTSNKSWYGFIQFDHKDPSMSGEDVDFEDTSKMKVTLIIDDFDKEAKRMEVKGSAYD